MQFRGLRSQKATQLGFDHFITEIFQQFKWKVNFFVLIKIINTKWEFQNKGATSYRCPLLHVIPSLSPLSCLSALNKNKSIFSLGIDYIGSLIQFNVSESETPVVMTCVDCFKPIWICSLLCALSCRRPWGDHHCDCLCICGGGAAAAVCAHFDSYLQT